MIRRFLDAAHRLAWWRKNEPLIVSLRVIGNNDGSSLEMVSEKWIKRQERINEAAAEVLRLSREFAEAQELFLCTSGRSAYPGPRLGGRN